MPVKKLNEVDDVGGGDADVASCCSADEARWFVLFVDDVDTLAADCWFSTLLLLLLLRTDTNACQHGSSSVLAFRPMVGPNFLSIIEVIRDQWENWREKFEAGLRTNLRSEQWKIEIQINVEVEGQYLSVK